MQEKNSPLQIKKYECKCCGWIGELNELTLITHRFNEKKEQEPDMVACPNCGCQELNENFI